MTLNQTPHENFLHTPLLALAQVHRGLEIDSSRDDIILFAL